MSNKIEMSEREILGTLQILANISRQRLPVGKGQYNLKRIIEAVFEIDANEKLQEKHRELFESFMKEVESAPNEKGETTKNRVFDEARQEEYNQAFDDLFKKVHTIDRRPVTIDLLENLDLRLSMEELGLLSKIIVEN